MTCVDCIIFGLICGIVAIFPIGIVLHFIWRVLTPKDEGFEEYP